ncbi:hypothetical protein ABL968_02820 [Pseudomonas aeruginosa]|uniref:hypothetical protein n=2 Tax=Pseudomonas aeruginosa TaxID=287 RepID=UPI003527487F
MKQSQFRAELVKIMPGYNWTVHASRSSEKLLVATGIQSSGSNRLSTLRVQRRDDYAGSGKPHYEVSSAGYGTRSPGCTPPRTEPWHEPFARFRSTTRAMRAGTAATRVTYSVAGKLPRRRPEFLQMNDYKSAFNAAAADLGAIIALLGFTKYPGVDPVLRAITDLMLEKAENQVLREERDAALARVAEVEAKLADLEKQEPFYYFADCDDTDHSGLHNTLGDALTQVADHGGSVVELYRKPPAQAQHSAPEVSGIGRDTGHPRAVVLYLRKEPTDDDLRAIHDALRSLAAAPGKEVPQAWLDVQAERRRQITAEGWTPEHDDAHSHGEMARAAACYALAGSSAPNDGTAALLVSLAWPWDEQWWKPSTARRDMVKACALGLAEIERLDRVAASQGGPSDA